MIRIFTCHETGLLNLVLKLDNLFWIIYDTLWGLEIKKQLLTTRSEQQHKNACSILSSKTSLAKQITVNLAQTWSQQINPCPIREPPAGVLQFYKNHKKTFATGAISSKFADLKLYQKTVSNEGVFL